MCQGGSTVNTLFAPYQPDAHGVPLSDALIRRGTREDLAFTGVLSAQREGGVPAEWTAQHQRKFADPTQALFVAEHEGEVIGYGWLAWLDPEAQGGRNAPEGWYLGGVVVAPAFRRRGLGRRLTQARIDWALDRADAVHYVVSASNQASRTLHATLGFAEITTDFRFPGVVFSRDDGILCRLDRRPDARIIDLAAHRGH